MKTINKKRLYNSIMKDVSRIIELNLKGTKRINEEVALAAPENAICLFDSTDLYDEDDYEVGYEFEFDAILQNLSDLKDDFERVESKQPYSQIMLCGDVQRWTGRRTIVPMFFSDLSDAWEEITNKGYDDIKVFFIENGEEADGYLTIHCIHHDGTNVFNLYMLQNTEECWDCIEFAEENGDSDFENFMSFVIPMQF